MSNRISERPAILGGTPVRPAGPPTWPRSDSAVGNALQAMIASGDWGRYHGPHVPALSRRLAEFHRVEHVLLSSSGTSAMELALRGVGVGPGDEVIMAAYDFKSNFQNVLHLQAVPVLVDLNPITRQLDHNQLDTATTEKTRAIVMSHLHGGVVVAPAVREWAETRKLAIVEDACQNPGALLFGRRAGTWGDIGVLSFGGSKLMTAGRGGAILTSRTDLFERIKRHYLRGNDAYPLSEIQAAIVLPQLDQLDKLNEHRCQNVIELFTKLGEDSGLIPLQLPNEEIQPAYYKLGCRYNPDRFAGVDRTRFVAAMRAEGIAFDAGFRSNHLIHATRRFRSVGKLPHATQADSDIVTLYHPVLMETSASIEQIVIAVGRIRESAVEIAQQPSTTPDVASVL